ncbi:MAG: phosphoribosylformylglycinamidine synthase, partial [Clostridiales bacterium]|nr:phosphoribosylformylglycinamidine synthase [Clostridiales bacterium]
AKITAMGGDYRNIRLTFQEFFERLGDDPKKWGKPFASLLGAIHAQESMGLPAIGGKDSMSGTFEDITVPPTLVAFAVTTGDARKIISPEFKSTDSAVVLLELKKDENDLPNFSQLDRNYTCVHKLIQKGKIRGIHSVRNGGIAEAISKMCFGNRIGFEFEPVAESFLYQPLYGSLLLELSSEENLSELFTGLDYQKIGHTQDEYVITVNSEKLSLDDIFKAWDSPLESVFPTHVAHSQDKPEVFNYKNCNTHSPAISLSAPRVFIPTFPGTNCEYDVACAFEKAGAIPDVMVMRNLTAQEIKESLSEMAKRIRNSQILMIPGGYSGGDEPFGSGKFIEAAFRNPEMKDAVMELLNKRDGLILGISNGFQALIKLGLVPYGEIRDIGSDSPTLVCNTIGRHMSKMVQTRISSVLSPWLALTELGAIHTIPVSHGEGRFVADPATIKELADKGQIATQYVDLEGNPTNVFPYNPNGSAAAIEGITSPDGRVFGKMGHSQRIGSNVGVNVPGENDQLIFESGVHYFK